MSSGVSMLETNIAAVIVNGTKDETAADSVMVYKTLMTATMYKTSPILASDWPTIKRRKLCFVFNLLPHFQC